ncbi:hypothetical protein [Roseitranquillus sediminis]|uniref:hypothetical protein n=1 Tax=Roseitranquillus sediminis TaxID=2809051 RepID=UPI001D0C5231|nr:hypothetical protein [Roseitranquillus sediminis]MBM9593893.1 hypothetical protein [Roseitranquillus sediminis]
MAIGPDHTGLPMELVKAFGKLLGWLSGVLAGITAVLYAFGFIATVTHQGMLGLELANTSREPLWYLGLGAQIAARWALQAMLALMLVLVLGETVRWLSRRARAEAAAEPGRIARTARWLDRQTPWGIAVLALFLIGYMMSAFGGALGIRGLLFAAPEAICTRDGVVGDIVAADLRSLSSRADQVVFFAVAALGICGYAVPRLAAGQAGALPLLICGAVTLQAVGAVPSAHGLFVLRPELRSLAAEGDGIGAHGEALYLLARTEDGLWAWEPGTQRLHWFAGGSYSHLRIGRTHSIGALLCPPGAGDGA